MHLRSSDISSRYSCVKVIAENVKRCFSVFVVPFMQYELFVTLLHVDIRGNLC